MSYEWIETALPGWQAQKPAKTRLDKSDVAPPLALAREALFAQQSPEGFWCGELTADTTLESDYILLQLWLHQPRGS